MKLSYLLIIVGLVVSLSITSLQSPEAHAQEESTIRVHSFFGGTTHARWENAMINEYNEAHPELKINYSSTGLYSSPIPLRSLNTQINHEVHPDVFMGFIGGGALHTYIEQGLIADISDLWEEMGWYDQYPQSVIDMASYEGKQYFVPGGMQWNPVFYNTTVFADNNIEPPQTWAELLATCDQLYAAGVRPFTVSTSGWIPPSARWFTMLSLRLNGAEFHDQLMQGTISWEDDRVRAIFEHWQEAFTHNCFGDDIQNVNYAAAVGELAEGQAAMYLLGEWIYESNAIIEAADQIDFFRFPSLNDEFGHDEIVHYYGAYMHANTEHPEEAREFLRHFGSAETQLAIVENVRRAVATNTVDSNAMPAYQQKGVQFVAESRAIVPLFEVSPFDNTVAVHGLNRLKGFHSRWNEEGIIDELLSFMEEIRLQELPE